MGCIFSEIYGNHIFNIAIKREFYGHEIAGIKLHAPIDVHMHNNRIHDCSLGIWLDWQAQGARINKNLLYDNNRDLLVEVSHGPTLVDNNILGSRFSMINDAQGFAYVHNLFAGKIELLTSTDRATPYHVPHSTDVAGFSAMYGGDDRYYQNIFVGNRTADTAGTAVFDGHPVSLEEYIELVDVQQPCDHDVFFKVKQPVYIAGNLYTNGAKAFGRETDKLDKPEFDPGLAIVEDGEKVYLELTMPEEFDSYLSAPHNTRTLGRTRTVDADYEDFDGSFLELSSDYLDQPVEGESVPGPLGCLKSGFNRICVWQG